MTQPQQQATLQPVASIIGSVICGTKALIKCGGSWASCVLETGTFSGSFTDVRLVTSNNQAGSGWSCDLLGYWTRHGGHPQAASMLIWIGKTADGSGQEVGVMVNSYFPPYISLAELANTKVTAGKLTYKDPFSQ